MAEETPTGVPTFGSVAAEVIAELKRSGHLPGGTVGQAPGTPASPGGAVLHPPAPHPPTAPPPPPHGATLPPAPTYGNPFEGVGGAGRAPGGATPMTGGAGLPPVSVLGLGDYRWNAPSGWRGAGTAAAHAALSAPGGPSVDPDDVRLIQGQRRQNLYEDIYENVGRRDVDAGYSMSDMDMRPFESVAGSRGGSAFPSMASERARNAANIDEHGKTTAAFDIKRPFFRSEQVPQGVNFERFVQHRDRAYIGHWQNAMAHTTGMGHAFMSASPSSDLGVASSAAGIGTAAGMAYANPALAIGSMVAGAGFNIASGAVDFTHQKIMEQASLERARLQMSNMGVDVGNSSKLVTEGRGMGFRPSESTWMLRQYYGSIGHKDANRAMNPLAANLAGVDLGAMAFFQQGGGPGGGGIGDSNKALSMAMGTGYETLGLRDSKLTEYLSRIAAATEGMKERGLNLNREGLNDFVAGLATAGKSTGVFQGVRGAQVGMNLSNQALGVGQSLMAPFKQLGDATILAAAAKEGGDAFDVNERIQKWSSDPRKVYEVMRSAGLSEQAQRHYFAGSGMSAGEARVAARGEIPRGMGVDSKDVKGSYVDEPGGFYEMLHKQGFGDRGGPFSGRGAEMGSIVAGMEQDVIKSLKDLPIVLQKLTEVMQRGAERQTAFGQGVGGELAGAWQDFLDVITGAPLTKEARENSKYEKLFGN